MENSKSSEVEVNGNNFKQEVLESSIPVLVDFWASWCMPCRMIAPTIEKLAKENQGKLKVCKLNTDENQHIAAQYGIQGIPTLIVFKEGKEVVRTVGVMPKEKLQEKLNPIL
ncbi:MAG: thioredoxin [Candidatus Atribacteria bacterium]|nr:thioredoxin [Candidatus Atribacteria bacterium]